jgi:hypothetical protein
LEGLDRRDQVMMRHCAAEGDLYADSAVQDMGEVARFGGTAEVFEHDMGAPPSYTILPHERSQPTFPIGKFSLPDKRLRPSPLLVGNGLGLALLDCPNRSIGRCEPSV